MNESRYKNDDRFEIDLRKIVSKGWTTLMIRNIPNKYTKEQMLATINRKFKDKFDFFYLPIDFFNECNVGYAFINFIDLRDIESFYRSFNNQKWARFNSEKICKINYARIQGKVECERHFKDSSLM